MEFDGIKEVGEYLKSYSSLDDLLNNSLEKAKDNKSFVCPQCGHGSRNSKQGLAKMPNSDLYKCFKCGLTGDIFQLLQIKENISYSEAVRKIAEWENFNFTIGNKKPMETPKTENAISQQNTKADNEEKKRIIKELNKRTIEEAKANFTEDGEAMQYLKSRGFYYSICKKYGIGYNTKYNFAKNSVIIPTSESSFIYRVIEEGGNKGNSGGEQHLFNENLLSEIMLNYVLGIHETANRLFICEGWADALSLLQSGFQAIALNSVNNINKLLKPIKENKDSFNEDFYFLLALDNDTAGKTATEKLMAEFKDIGLNAINATSFLLSSNGKSYKDINEAYTANRELLESRADLIYKNPALDIKRTLYKEQSSTNNLLELLTSYETKRQKAISTGFKSLDSVLYGGFYSGLYILGAVSSLGKTSFALQIASNIAECGQDVLIFSLEMSSKELLAKIISRFTFEINRDYPRNTIEILNNYIEDEYKPTRSKAFERLQKFSDRIYISEGIGNITTEQIKNKIAEHIEITGNTPFVIVDYVQIIAPFDYKMTDKQATDRNIIELKRISRDYNLTIFGISSFNRESYKEEVSLTSFKESGAIEYGSDVLIGMQYKGIEREVNFGKVESDKDYNARKANFYKELEEKRTKGEFIPLQIKILKNRNGKTSKVDFYFKPPYNYFTDDEVTKKIMEK